MLKKDKTEAQKYFQTSEHVTFPK